MDAYLLNGFEYFDLLQADVIGDFPESLNLQYKPSSEAVLFRLLLGSISLKWSESENVVEQKIFYGQLKDVFEDHTFTDPIREWLSPDFGLVDVDTYFKRNKSNKAIFDELLIEFSLFFIQKKNANHTSAFLHLYRALEYMSYSFPISYSARTTSYFSTFDTFKAFFTNKEAGQLKFFRDFIKVIFDKSTLRYKLKIDTFVGEDILDRKKMQIIKKICSDFSYSTNGSVVEIEYQYLLDFMINVRNRYFHFQYDRNDNISNMHFNSESFFDSMNDKFASWLALIYFEIMTQGVFKVNLMPLS